MNTIQHEHLLHARRIVRQHEIEHSHSHNLFGYIIERMWGMYKKPDHTLGDFILLYVLIFAAILVVLLIVAPFL